MHQFYKAVILLILLTSKTIFATSNIVIVDSYDHELSLKRGMLNSIKSQLEDVKSLQIFYLNSKKSDESTYTEKARLIEKKITSINPNLVFLADDNALKLLGPNLISKGLKIVFLGINGNPRNYLSPELLHKVSGVLERPLFFKGYPRIKALL